MPGVRAAPLAQPGCCLPPAVCDAPSVLNDATLKLVPPGVPGSADGAVVGVGVGLGVGDGPSVSVPVIGAPDGTGVLGPFAGPARCCLWCAGAGSSSPPKMRVVRKPSAPIAPTTPSTPTTLRARLPPRASRAVAVIASA